MKNWWKKFHLFFGLICVVLPMMIFKMTKRKNIHKRHLIYVFISLGFFLVSLKLSSQINLNFAWYFNHSKIDLSDLPFKTMNADSLSFENLKCYISKIECLKDDQVVYAENNSFHLLDAAIEESLKISIACNRPFNKIRFLLGVDSVTSVSGAMGGDLDPSLGMYWTWQSGYINCKIEGTSRLCKNPKKTFQFHLGGYAYPFKNYRVLNFNTNGSDSQHIMIQMADWFKACQLQQTDHLMSPSAKAQDMMRIFSDCFKLSTP